MHYILLDANLSDAAGTAAARNRTYCPQNTEIHHDNTTGDPKQYRAINHRGNNYI